MVGRIAFSQERQEFLGTQVGWRTRAPRIAATMGSAVRLGDDPGLRERSSSPAGPCCKVALDPLVGGLTGDAGALGELRDGVESLGVEGDEAGTFEHGVGDSPGHGGLGRAMPG